MKDHSGWILGSLIFWGVALSLKPFFNFPLNDEWAFAYTVNMLLRTGHFVVSDAATPTVVVQAFWGTLFAKLFGLGYGPLRLSTLVLAWLGGSSFYFFLRRIQFASFDASMLTLLLWFNPLFFILSLSFMTDVPALSLSMAALALSWYGISRRPVGLRWLILGSTFVALAYGVRQTGLMLPVGLTLVLWRRGQLNAKNAAGLWVIPLAALVAHQCWRYHNGPTVGSIMYAHNSEVNLIHPLSAIVYSFRRAWAAAVYCGFFVLPVTVAFWLDRPLARLRPQRLKLLLGVSAVLVPFLFLWGWLPSPGFSQYMSRSGLGVFNILGAQSRALPLWGDAWFWAGLGIISCVSCATIVAMNIKEAALPALFWAVPLTLELLPPMLSPVYYDRYLLPLIPAALVLGLKVLPKSRWSRGFMCFGVSIFGIISSVGTSDYFHVSRAAWSLGELAVEQGLEPGQVLASSEWCWAHGYEEKMAQLKIAKGVMNIQQSDIVSFCKDPVASVSFIRPEQKQILAPRSSSAHASEGASASFYSPWTAGVQNLYLHYNQVNLSP